MMPIHDIGLTLIVENRWYMVRQPLRVRLFLQNTIHPTLYDCCLSRCKTVYRNLTDTTLSSCTERSRYLFPLSWCYRFIRKVFIRSVSVLISPLRAVEDTNVHVMHILRMVHPSPFIP